jgi:pimeloyl-ACP methyl ester carboxylesterase
VESKKMSLLLACALFLPAGVPTVVSARGHQVGQEPPSALIDTLVSVGGNRLHFNIIEGGSPAILLESGGGMDLTQWVGLPARLARETGSRVISYSRAGFGKSDLPDIPHDMRMEAHWLWDALGRLGLDQDLVLVGHSFGGWMVRLEASEFADSIRGIVFIDPFSAEFVDQLGVAYLDDHPLTGKIPFDTSDPSRLTKLQRALVRMVGDGLGPKMEIMRTTVVPEGIPVVIMTSGRPTFAVEEEQQAWRWAHERMAASIPGAVLIVAEESSHMIPWSQPDLVVEAVKRVLNDIRGR